MTLPMRLSLLGEFRLWLGDSLVTTLNTPRLQSLFAYLVLHADAPQPRRQIAFALWPDMPEARARANLRKLFHQLQQVLPEAAAYLEVDAQTIQWNLGTSFWLDVAEFERLAHSPQTPADLQRALDLYGGELLPDCYDEWIVVPRERLHTRFMQALEQVITYLEQSADYAAALQQALRLLRHDPLREITYRHLIRLHALNGDRAGVVRMYHTCVTVLQRELAVDPSVETQQEYERALQMNVPRVREIKPERATQPNNLPTQGTSFIGRESEKNQVKHLLNEQRLVTLVGAGGVGKTRLAQAVATDLMDVHSEFVDGVWLMDLAPLTDGTLIASAMARVLGLRESPRRTLLDTLTDYLSDKHMLLILDNCEHLIEAVRALAETILSSGSMVRILATSREPLGTQAEQIQRLSSLSLPPLDELAALGEEGPVRAAARPHSLLSKVMPYESVWLFVDRAAAVLPTFTLTEENALAVAQICAQLDGIPLALELAAARIKILTPLQIAQRLNDVFHLLTRGTSPTLARHPTLLATLDWSFALLGEAERVLFRRLAVFGGGCTLEAVEAICSGLDLPQTDVLDLVAEVVDKSLLVVEEQSGQARYRLLETTRQYAQQKLAESGEGATIHKRHGDFYLDLIERAEPELEGARQRAWFEELEKEQSNWRAALDHFIKQKDVERALRLVGALRVFWEARGQWSEGRREADQVWQLAAARFDQENNPSSLESYIKVRFVTARLAYLQGEYVPAQAAFEQALQLAEANADRKSVAFALQGLSDLARGQAQPDRARELCLQALHLAREINDQAGVARALSGLASIALNVSDLPQAYRYYQESLALYEELGDERGKTLILSYLGIIAYQQGDYPIARTYWEQQLASARAMADQAGMASALNALGRLYFGQMDYATAQTLLEESLAISKKIGERPRTSILLGDLGEVLRFQGNAAAAFKFHTEGLALSRKLNRPWRIADMLYGLGCLMQVQHDDARARDYFAESLATYRKIENKLGLVMSLMGLASVIGLQGEALLAAQLMGAAEASCESQSISLGAHENLDYERHLTLMRQRLAEESFEQARAQGRTLTLEEAIDLALAPRS